MLLCWQFPVRLALKEQAMQLEQTFKRRPLSLTSLIDVIFLLLLFFMFTSTFSKFADVELATSGSGSSDSETITAFAQFSSSGLTINGQIIEVSRLQIELLRLKRSNRTNMLILAVDKTASSQQLVDVLVTFRDLEDISLQLVK